MQSNSQGKLIENGKTLVNDRNNPCKIFSPGIQLRVSKMNLGGIK